MTRPLSGQKLARVSPDSGLGIPLQNFPEKEFSPGWRERPLASMTGREVERFFDEMIVLWVAGGERN